MLRRKLIPATALAVMSLGLAAVGGPSAASAATPTRGGTLTILGQSDVFNLDTVSAYYTVSSFLERMFTRQLFGYPDASTFSAEEVVTPDVATVIPDHLQWWDHRRGQDVHGPHQARRDVEHEPAASGHFRRLRP